MVLRRYTSIPLSDNTMPQTPICVRILTHTANTTKAIYPFGIRLLATVSSVVDLAPNELHAYKQYSNNSNN